MLPQLGAALLPAKRRLLPPGRGMLRGERAEVLRRRRELLPAGSALLPRRQRQMLPARRTVLPGRRQALLRTAVAAAPRTCEGRGPDPGSRPSSSLAAGRPALATVDFAAESPSAAAKQSPGEEL